MSAPSKGYPSDKKSSALEYVTVEPIREHQHGESVMAHMFVRLVTADTTEAGSTDTVIVATAHSALAGDVIELTSGVLSGREVKVLSVATNSITLVEAVPSAIGSGVTFNILRHKYPVSDSSGNIIVSSVASGPIQFTRDSITTTVTEDTVTPANNRPLPVKLTGFDGDVSINASNLNLDVQLTHTTADFDSIRIGDGTDLLAISGSGEISAIVTSEPATAADGGALPATTKVISGYDGANVQVIHTDASGDLQVDVLTMPSVTVTATNLDIRDLVQATDSVAIGDGTDIIAISAAGEASVTLTTALPSGTNNIGDVDVLTEPATAADGGALPGTTKVVSGYDGTNVQVIHTDASGDLQVDVLTMPSVTVTATDLDIRDLTHVSDSVKVGDGTDFLAISAAGEASVAVTSALPAGNNNIGDVDVASVVPGTGATNLGKAEDAVHSSGDVGVMSLAVRNDAGTALAADGDYIPVMVNGVGSVYVANTSVVPGTGATNLGKAEDAGHTTGDVGVMALAVRNDAGTALATTTLDYIPLTTDSLGNLRVVGSAAPVASLGRSVVTTVRNDYTSVNVTTGAWVQLIASTGATVNEIEIFDSSGQTLELGTGAAAAETRLILVFPGGNGRVPTAIASGTRVSIRAVSATADVGELDINLYG